MSSAAWKQHGRQHSDEPPTQNSISWPSLCPNNPLPSVSAACMYQQVPFPSCNTVGKSLAPLSHRAARTGKGDTEPWVPRAVDHLEGTGINPAQELSFEESLPVSVNATMFGPISISYQHTILVGPYLLSQNCLISPLQCGGTNTPYGRMIHFPFLMGITYLYGCVQRGGEIL